MSKNILVYNFPQEDSVNEVVEVLKAELALLEPGDSLAIVYDKNHHVPPHGLSEYLNLDSIPISYHPQLSNEGIVNFIDANLDAHVVDGLGDRHNIERVDNSTIIEQVRPSTANTHEYIQSKDMSISELSKDLLEQFNTVMESSNEEFVQLMGLPEYFKNDDIGIFSAKQQLYNDLSTKFQLPVLNQVGLDNIGNILERPTKIYDAIKDGIEYAYDLVGDKDVGHLKLDLGCTSLSDCHIKGVYRELENDREHHSSVEMETNFNELDTTAKAEEIIANNFNFGQDNSNDSGREIEV